MVWPSAEAGSAAERIRSPKRTIPVQAPRTLRWEPRCGMGARFGLEEGELIIDTGLSKGGRPVARAPLAEKYTAKGIGVDPPWLQPTAFTVV